LDELIQAEIQKADDKHGEFSSCHEGISVLLKEIEGADAVLKSIKKHYDEVWKGVKTNDFSAQLPEIARLYLMGLYLAKEAIHVTAMSEKYFNHVVKNNPQVAMKGQQDMLGK
jgi:uncharacterized protein (DUF111 family)